MAGKHGSAKKKSAKKKTKSAQPTGTQSADAAFVLKLLASADFNSSLECVAEAINDPSEDPQGKLLSVDQGDLSDFLEWFATGLVAEPHAKLTFSTDLTKEDRAIVHKLVENTFSEQLETLSEGVETERTISIFRKGQAQRKQLSPEDISKAAALYALSRDQSSLCKLSKDEIAEMVATKTVKGDLEALWNSSKADLAAGNALLAAIASENDAPALLSAVESAKALIRRGAPLLGTSEMPLHAAVRAGRLDALRALLAAGAPLEAKDGNGRTALQVSRTFEQCDAEAILLQAGAHDPDAKLFPLSAAVAELNSPKAAAASCVPLPSSEAGPLTSTPAKASPDSNGAHSPCANLTAKEVDTLLGTPSAPPAVNQTPTQNKSSPSTSEITPAARAAPTASSTGDCHNQAATGGSSHTVSGSGDGKADSTASFWGASSAPPAAIPGWGTVAAAMKWAQDPENAAVVVAGFSCVTAAAAFMMFGSRRGR